MALCHVIGLIVPSEFQPDTQKILKIGSSYREPDGVHKASELQRTNADGII